MTELAKKIHALRDEGKSYNDIVKELHCSKGTVSYYLGEGQKDKNLSRSRRNRAKAHPYSGRLYDFRYRAYKTLKNNSPTRNITKLKVLRRKWHDFSRVEGKVVDMKKFSLEDLIKKIGEKPVCYLTGTPIDITKSGTYQFDHIIPRSRGGTNDLQNLDICTKQANQAKRNLTDKEFIALCRSVVEHSKI